MGQRIKRSSPCSNSFVSSLNRERMQIRRFPSCSSFLVTDTSKTIFKSYFWMSSTRKAKDIKFSLLKVSLEYWQAVLMLMSSVFSYVGVKSTIKMTWLDSKKILYYLNHQWGLSEKFLPSKPRLTISLKQIKRCILTTISSFYMEAPPSGQSKWKPQWCQTWFQVWLNR